MTWEFRPLRIKTLLESNPLRPKLLVSELGIFVTRVAFRFWLEIYGSTFVFWNKLAKKEPPQRE